MMHSTSFWMLFIFLTRYVISLPHEAVCSPYHYEEQTLVKTVKLEQTVKDHIRHNEETEARVRGDFERLESEIKTLKSRLNEYDKEQGKILFNDTKFNIRMALCHMILIIMHNGKHFSTNFIASTMICFYIHCRIKNYFASVSTLP